MVTLTRMVPPESDDFLVRLFREHGTALRKHLGRLLRNRDDAEDVAQETYAKLFRLARPESIANPRGWLFTAAVRMAATHLKRAQRTPTVPLSPEAEQVPDEHPLPEAHGIGRDALRHLQGILRELPRQQGRVFYRYRILGESREDVAAQLSITLSTFEQHLWKADAYCQQRLKALGLGEQGGEKL